MGFTVSRRGGLNGAGFETYSRWLRQRGIRLGSLPRVPDPKDPERRWAYAWNDEGEAKGFAADLREQTDDPTWQVEPIDVPASIGPFGPILIQLARRSDGLAFTVHPLSRAMIGEAFAQARPVMTNAFIDLQTWDDFRKSHGDLSQVVAELLPDLTGINPKELAGLGYAVIDADTDRVWVDVPPDGIANARV